MRENRAAFARHRIVPRMLRGVERPDASVELFGRRLDSPFLLAPVGVLELAHREADVAVARAARRTGVPMIFSNQASRPMEECAEALGDSPRWFQLYWSTSDELVESLVGRAEACGCEAIVLTLDTTIVGWRPRDLEPAFLPFLRGQGIAQYTSDPVFRRLMAGGPSGDGAPQPPPTPQALRTLVAAHARLSRLVLAQPAARATGARRSSASPRSSRARRCRGTTCRSCASARSCRSCSRASCTPTTPGGRSTPGVDGIVVSNHGGRQVDGAIATLDALPAVAAAVDGRVPVLLDSGVRGGRRRLQGARARRERGADRARLRLRPRGRRRGGRRGGARQPARGARPDDGARRLRLARRGRARDARASRLSVRRLAVLALAAALLAGCGEKPEPAASARDRRHRHGRPRPARAGPARRGDQRPPRRRDRVDATLLARLRGPRRAAVEPGDAATRGRQGGRRSTSAADGSLPRPRPQAQARAEPLRARRPLGRAAALEGRHLDHPQVAGVLDVATAAGSLLAAFGLSGRGRAERVDPAAGGRPAQPRGPARARRRLRRGWRARPALIVLGVLFVLDFVGDKVPAVDSLLHAVGTIVHPASGAIVFAGPTEIPTDVPSIVLFALGASVAGSLHATRATIRPASTTLTAGAGNPLLSLAEDIGSAVLSVRRGVRAAPGRALPARARRRRRGAVVAADPTLAAAARTTLSAAPPCPPLPPLLLAARARRPGGALALPSLRAEPRPRRSSAPASS